MRLPVTLCATILATAASANLADDTYSLKWSPKEGDTATYTEEGTFSVNVGDATLKGKLVEKVIKVAPDGSYTVQFTPQDGTVTYQGTAVPTGRTITLTTYKADGEVLSVTGEHANAQSTRYANLSAFKRPDNPLKVGDSWNFEVKADPKNGVVAVQAIGHLVDAEKLGAADALKVTLSSHETDVTQPGSIDTTYWIDQHDGSLLQYQAKWNAVSFPGAQNPLSGTMSMEKVPN